MWYVMNRLKRRKYFFDLLTFHQKLDHEDNRNKFLGRLIFGIQLFPDFTQRIAQLVADSQNTPVKKDTEIILIKRARRYASSLIYH